MTDTTFFLRTARLQFRHWCEADLHLAMGLWGDPEVTKRFDRRGRLNERQVRERLLQEIHHQQTYGVQYWPLFDRATGHHIGAAGLRLKDVKNHQYEIGFHIRSVFWRQGFGAEAAGAVISYAFDSLQASSLFAGHHPENVASRQLLKTLGFRYTHDEYYEPTARMHPSYVLTAADYRRQDDGP